MKPQIQTTLMKTQATRLIRSALATATLAAVLITSLSLHAAKPGGGGGGGGSSPSGTIYFYTLPGGESQPAYSMKPDGSQKTALGVEAGTVSTLAHGGKRWFLQRRLVPGEHVVPGYARSEMFAVREDGALTVQLTDDAAASIYLEWTPAETSTDAIIAGVGQRWNLDGTPDLASIGVYSATLRFDADGNVIGLDAPPSFLVSIGIAAHEFDGTPVPNTWTGVSFSPDMTKLVADHYYTSNGLRIVDIATGAETPLVSGWAKYPAWSPNGAKIAFVVPGVYEKIDVVSSNGTGRSSIFRAKSASEYFYNPSWSPDSAHIAFTFWPTWPFDAADVWRVGVNGGSKVNLTQDLSVRAAVLGWR